uniref:Uncharacterized protein n=1 Tax=Caldiarchaeum subterraneum TaxID=311458 RepID=A0A7J3VTQ6_CALS0
MAAGKAGELALPFTRDGLHAGAGQPVGALAAGLPAVLHRGDENTPGRGVVGGQGPRRRAPAS